MVDYSKGKVFEITPEFLLWDLTRETWRGKESSVSWLLDSISSPTVIANGSLFNAFTESL